MEFTVEKHMIGYSYARNGNAHNPTPKVEWLVRDADGKVVDRAPLRRIALQYAEEHRKGESRRDSD